MVCSRIFQACPQLKCNPDQIVVEDGKCCPRCVNGKPKKLITFTHIFNNITIILINSNFCISL